VVRAESPQPAEKPAAQFPQIELDSKFFTISASAARRLGLKHEPGDSGAKWPGILSASAYEKLFRVLNAEKSVKLLSSPRVTTKSGQTAVVEVIREFRYPTAFEESGDHLAPREFVTINTGVSMVVEPVLSPAGDLIELTASTKLIEFNRFVTYAEGRTQKSEPIPKGGFSQPLFDRTQNLASVVLRPGQTILLDGSEWTGASGLSIERLMNPGAAKSAVDTKSEPELLFAAVTASLISPVPDLAGPMNEGGPVEITSEIVNISRDRLPVGAWKDVKLAPGGAPTPTIAGVLNPSQAQDFRKAFISDSGGESSAAPKKVIAPGGRYSVESTGFLRYPGKSGKTDGSGHPETAAKPETEQMDFRIEVEPHASSVGIIDLNITTAQTTSPASNEEDAPGSSPGIASAKWGFDDDHSPAARERGRAITTAVSIWNTFTVVLGRATQGRADHIQLLLITAKMTGTGEKALAPDKADAQEWPSASPVPGKPGFVTSPYQPDAGYIDVRGFPKGTEVKDPYTGRKFLVP
jgi:hypothetical protein